MQSYCASQTQWEFQYFPALHSIDSKKTVKKPQCQPEYWCYLTLGFFYLVVQQINYHTGNGFYRVWAGVSANIETLIALRLSNNRLISIDALIIRTMGIRMFLVNPDLYICVCSGIRDNSVNVLKMQALCVVLVVRIKVISQRTISVYTVHSWFFPCAANFKIVDEQFHLRKTNSISLGLFALCFQ